MLTLKTIPVLLKIVGKLDLKPLIGVLKEADIFKDPESSRDAIDQLSKEKLGLIAVEAIAALTPQLGKIADDLPELAAAYKGISLEDAYNLDAAEIIGEIIHDEGIKSFFGGLLRKKEELQA